ncbi:unnamed protein product, partial [Heterosigma akashiwo]
FLLFPAIFNSDDRQLSLGHTIPSWGMLHCPRAFLSDHLSASFDDLLCPYRPQHTLAVWRFGISRELKVCFIFWFIFHNLALATTLVHYFSDKGGVYRYVPHVIVAVDVLFSFLVTVAWPLHTHSPSHMRKRHYRTPKTKIPSLVRYWSFWGLRAVRRRLQQTVHLGRRRSSQVQAASRVTFDGLPTR